MYWWDKYNGYAISDYWQEFSRGKLHVIGQAEFIILSREISYYENLGIATVNKEIYDTLKNRLRSKWKQYDQWKLISDGVFAWQKDSLVDMIYTVFRQRRPFIFDGDAGLSGISSLGTVNGVDSNFSYTAYDSSGSVVKIYSPPFAEFG